MTLLNPEPVSDNPLDCKCTVGSSRKPGESTKITVHRSKWCPVHTLKK